jgi:tetratricopeptide (TPR) repeat protein
LSYTIPDGDVETKNYDELELKVKLNISAVRLARGKYRDTIDYCEQIRRSDPNNLKATFRKATSHLELNEFDEAEKEIQRLQDLKGAAEDITILQNKLSSYVILSTDLESRPDKRKK